MLANTLAFIMFIHISLEKENHMAKHNDITQATTFNPEEGHSWSGNNK